MALERIVACDAGGLLVASQLVPGTVPAASEIVALDWVSVTVGRFLAGRFDEDYERVSANLGVALFLVDEWFPVRNHVADALERCGLEAVDALDSWSALILAEFLAVPLFTASDEVTSDQVEVIRPW